MIPHITDEIKNAIRRTAPGHDVVITEIGGTVGDIESLPFLEAIRQFRQEVGRDNALFIHLTLVPYIAAAGELKTKPTQHSVRDLMQIGIQPDILICRSEQPSRADIKRKIALFCNVDFGCVIESPDVQVDLRDPAPLPGAGPRPRGVSAATARDQGARSPAVESDDRADPASGPPGEDRRGRQVHVAPRRLQVGPGGADSRRNPARREGRDRMDPERPVHRSGRGGEDPVRIRRTAHSGRVRRAGRRRHGQCDPLGPGERSPVLRHLPRASDRHHRVRPQRLRISPTPTAPSSRRIARRRSSR